MTGTLQKSEVHPHHAETHGHDLLPIDGQHAGHHASEHTATTGTQTGHATDDAHVGQMHSHEQSGNDEHSLTPPTTGHGTTPATQEGHHKPHHAEIATN